ncbi:MAG: cytochrome c oxidase subunit II [Acidobacteriota bacterium]|nr:cytochrome c oxidase subunit II [Acidobacteriota bacterium]
MIFVRLLVSAARRVGLKSVALAAPLSAVIYLAAAQSASAACCTLKTGASPNETSIATLYDIILGLAVAVFLAVMAFLGYAIWKFRAHKNPVALQIHGNTRLEVSLTLSAVLILVMIATVTFIKLPGIINPPNSDAGASSVLSASLTAPNPPNGHTLTVCVTGRQFIWRYTYGANCNKSAWVARLPYSYQEMVVPSGVTVDLLIQSSDVIHAWWIPALGGKVDAVPGFTTYTWFKALHANELYHGQCAQLCGREHAYMTALVKVVTPAQYTAWLAKQSVMISQQNDQVAQIRQALVKQGIVAANGNF